MTEELNKIYVFLKRDFSILSTYRLAFATGLFSMVFNILSLIMFGFIFGRTELPVLAPYGGNFISYLLVGSLGWGFLWTISSIVSMSLRSEMVMGTLESILVTPTSLFSMILAYSLFGCFFGLISMLGVVAVGFALFGAVPLLSSNIFTFIVFMLSIILMSGFGMMLAGLTMWLKNIGEITALVQNITMLLSGVYFPIEILPESIRGIAKFVPFYYPMTALRKSLSPAVGSYDFMVDMLILLLSSIAFVVVGIYVLQKGVKKARAQGSLSFF